MIRIDKNMVSSDAGKLVHKIGSEAYFRMGVLLPGESADMFEEVDEEPPFTTAEYNAEVERLIAQRYTTGQEIQFAREKEEAGDKYRQYLEYVDECKRMAKENLNPEP